MIQVQGLTKTYRGRAVVDDISFEAGRGEIVGFLGPNGAGKSTTMRILSGFLLPTAGKVEIAGHDIVEESLQARRHLGYMPEDVPLYPEMRVEEYLRYRAGIKGVSRERLAGRVHENMERCGVSEVRRKLIGTLSKGYRQRIGLADALVHDPSILILDEPTNGLDPNQIRSVREIIRSLAGRHTVLLSTHILAEVEAVCERVIILDRGRIKATGDPSSLARAWSAEPASSSRRGEQGSPPSGPHCARFQPSPGRGRTTWRTVGGASNWMSGAGKIPGRASSAPCRRSNAPCGISRWNRRPSRKSSPA